MQLDMQALERSELGSTIKRRQDTLWMQLEHELNALPNKDGFLFYLYLSSELMKIDLAWSIARLVIVRMLSRR
jgi:hypothetical protein